MMKSHTPEWFDSMYNNRLLVPNALEHMTRWSKDSASVLNDPQITRHEARYATGPCALLDVYPASVENSHETLHDGLAPVVVFIHGGYWRALHKEDHAFLIPAFKALSVCTVMVSYDLCPQVTIKEIALEMVQALVWVYENIEKFGGNQRQIHVMGHSAGGHLSALLMTTLWGAVKRGLPADLIHSALSISGLFELDSIRQTPFLADDLRLDSKSACALSPAWMAAPKKGHLTALVGGLESSEFIRQTHLIASAWGQSVVPVCESLPGLNHFSILESLLDTQGALFKRTQEMIEAGR
jgi:arylformamidase